MKRRTVVLTLILSLVCLGTVVYLVGCGSSGGGGGSVEQPTTMSQTDLEGFWIDTYNTALPLDPQGIARALDGESPASALDGYSAASVEASVYSSLKELLAKAEPDECFLGIGDEGNLYDPYLQDECDHNKVNQAYVWGLAKSGDHLWFGTAPNVHCLVIGGYLGADLPHKTGSWVCEFGESQFSPPLPEFIGDWRPPRIFVYDSESMDLIEQTPMDSLIQSTLGIRSAGGFGNIVILGGPNLSPEGGINLFAFDTEMDLYLGSTTLFEYNNIRKWLVVNDVLYTAVGNSRGEGSVLRWIDDETHPDYPFAFAVVRELDGSGAELVEHEGHLFVSTWPSTELAGSGGLAGIWMSPKIPPEGLDESHASLWSKVWQVDAYEPDLVTAATYGGGALASFDGYLWWGTMHVPFLSTAAHFRVYGVPEDEEDVLKAVLGTYRAISIFRGSNFGTEDEDVALVYGMPRLPVFDGENWKIKPNNMGSRPLFGLSGFGNFFNNYTWTMGVYKDQLFVGTMDWSYLLYEVLGTFLKSQIGYVPDRKLRLPTRFFGADLWRFLCANAPAVPESLAGVGNYTSYGIRNMVSDDALYLGMANPMNLLTDLNDDIPEGGWELVKLTLKHRIKIDIKPGSYPNPINLKSRGKVPVAVLTTKCFRAEWVDPGTVIFAGAEPVRWTFEDVEGDGDTDLLFHFETQQLVLHQNSTYATLTGETFDAKEITGTDMVKIVPKGR